MISTSVTSSVNRIAAIAASVAKLGIDHGDLHRGSCPCRASRARARTWDRLGLAVHPFSMTLQLPKLALEELVAAGKAYANPLKSPTQLESVSEGLLKFWLPFENS